mmetsp:Transcript_20706/g.63983  ORF Transcript_20706/g.63983 Transcript_20706/m.63983 type:complete len:373 (-) Transcript_20706:379-1497(-)
MHCGREEGDSVSERRNRRRGDFVMRMDERQRRHKRRPRDMLLSFLPTDRQADTVQERRPPHSSSEDLLGRIGRRPALSMSAAESGTGQRGSPGGAAAVWCAAAEGEGGGVGGDLEPPEDVAADGAGADAAVSSLGPVQQDLRVGHALDEEAVGEDEVHPGNVAVRVPGAPSLGEQVPAVHFHVPQKARPAVERQVQIAEDVVRAVLVDEDVVGPQEAQRPRAGLGKGRAVGLQREVAHELALGLAPRHAVFPALQLVSALHLVSAATAVRPDAQRRRQRVGRARKIPPRQTQLRKTRQPARLLRRPLRRLGRLHAVLAVQLLVLQKVLLLLPVELLPLSGRVRRRRRRVVHGRLVRGQLLQCFFVALLLLLP